MRHPIIVGLQYGDEGKGKITDILASQAGWVVRFNGGSNAGHTIWLGNRKLVTHSVPSGVLYKTARNYIGAGCVVDPVSLRKELDDIAGAGETLGPARLRIDFRAHLTLPIHLALDGMRESGANSIGTTKRGIGPTYVTKLDRIGVRVGDLLDMTGPVKVKALCDAYNPRLKERGLAESKYEDNLAVFHAAREWMAEYIEKSETFFYDIARQEKVVLEGAQGVLLDADHGSYPYVTSSNTIGAQAAAGAPFPLSKLGPVVGIAKAYVTRVGLGDLATELNDATGERIRKNGHEFGATTGRPRRVGWINLDELKRAIRLTDCRYVVLSKSDVLSGEPEVKALADGQLHSFKGWGDLSGEKLPSEFETFVTFVEKFVGVPVSAVGTGVDRSHLVWRHSKPDFWADL